MKKRFSISTLILAVLVTATLTVNLTHYLTTRKLAVSSPVKDETETDITQSNLSDVLSQAQSLVDKYYINEIDPEKLEKYLMYGYLLGIEDKYGSYMTKSEFESYMQESEGHFVGIGVNIIYDTDNAGMYIINVHDGVPAQKAGLVPGDIITHVDGQSVLEMGYYQAINYIKKGKELEPVTLTIIGAPDYTEPKEVILERAVVDTVTVSQRMVEDNIAVIEISEFNLRTPYEFTDAIRNAQREGADRYIFDVRNNIGGELSSIVAVLDFLLPEGPMIRISGKDGKEKVIYSDAVELLSPMVVLTNGNTVSAAELFTSALRDYDKADIVGTKTYGKGTVVSTYSLPSGGALSISTKLYCPPFGENYEGKGISPDYECEMSEEQIKNFYLLTDSEDTQLQKAIDVIKSK